MIGQLVQKPRPIAAIHLNHRMRLRAFIGDNHARRHRHGPQACWLAIPSLLQRDMQIHLTTQSASYPCFKICQQFLIAHRLPIFILQAEAIKDSAIFSCVNACADNRQMRQRHSPRNSRKQTRVILGNHRHDGRVILDVFFKRNAKRAIIK